MGPHHPLALSLILGRRANTRSSCSSIAGECAVSYGTWFVGAAIVPPTIRGCGWKTSLTVQVAEYDAVAPRRRAARRGDVHAGVPAPAPDAAVAPVPAATVPVAPPGL